MLLNKRKSNENKVFLSKNLLKQAHSIGGKIFVVLHEDIVRKMGIDENTWFEQLMAEGGVLLKIRRPS